MSGVLAILNRDGQPVDPRVIEAMLAFSPYRARDGQRIWVDGPVALGHQHFWATPEEEGEEQPLCDTEGTRTITCDARLDNRHELAAALGLDPGEAHTASDAVLILRAYVRWGTGCVDHLLGDFAFAIWDGVERQLFLARDALGARGLSYYAGPQVFVAASEIKQCLAHPCVETQLNEGKVAEYLEMMWDDPHESFYDSIHYCPPAHAMVVTADSMRQWRYWDLDLDARIRYRSDEQYAEHFLHLFTAAVRCRLRTTARVAISLSGGLDSTSVAAVTAGILRAEASSQQRLVSLSYVFDELTSCDERYYIDPVVDRLALDAANISGDDKWPLSNLPDWPLDRDFIYFDPYVRLPLAVIQAAERRGCQLLLTGHYGDHLFEGGNYWPADMLRDLKLGQMCRALAGSPFPAHWMDACMNRGLRVLAPDVVRRSYRRARPRPRAWRHPGLHADLARRTHLEGRKERYARPPASVEPDRWERRSSLLESSGPQGMAAGRRLYNEAGLETASPFLDRSLVEYVMAVPAYQLGRTGRTKWVLRNAMVPLLPEVVRERRGWTEFGELFRKGVCGEEGATVRRILRDPQIVKGEFIRGEWLAEELHSCRPLAEDGLPLWLAICLELWLSRYW